MAKTAVLFGNQLAKGYNNFSGLANIELQAVGGNVPDDYLLSVDDLWTWLDGVDRVQGDGVTVVDGFASSGWQVGVLSRSQHYWLYTSILDGSRSGKVTARMHKPYFVPMDSIMSYQYIIVNAILTLLPIPDESRGEYVAGFSPFFYRFTRIDTNSFLHEDKMKGTLSVTGASTAQENIDTTPEKLIAFTTSGLNAGVTTSASDDSHTIIVAEDYEVEAVIDFTATVSTVWTFQFYVDGVAVGIKFLGTTNATPDAVQVVMKWQQAMDATDIVTIYVNSNDGGGTADITVTEAIFTVVSI